MRESVAALALIQTDLDGRPQWLAQWNARSGRFHFLGGHKRADESFRDCLRRELSEELGLTDADYTLGDAPRQSLDYVAWSESAQQPTQYRMAVFDVRLNEQTRRRIDADPQNVWLSDDEIRSGQTRTGQPVSESMSRILGLLGLL